VTDWAECPPGSEVGVPDYLLTAGSEGACHQGQVSHAIIAASS
jgi:hypothetical protein